MPMLNIIIMLRFFFSGGRLPVHGSRALGSQRGQRAHQSRHLLARDDPLRVRVAARVAQELNGGSVMGRIPGMHAK